MYIFCTLTDSNGDVFLRREINSLSTMDLNFFLNYIRRGQIIFKMSMPHGIPKVMKAQSCTNHVINDFTFGFEYKLWANIETRLSPKMHTEMIILTTPSDTEVTRDRRRANMKDLIIHDDGQSLGRFRLIPAQPNLWQPNVVYKDNLPFLKQLEYKGNDGYTIGFRSVSWPEAAMEWKSRNRLFDWPSESAIDEILETGARVVPSKISTGSVTGTNVPGNDDLKESIGNVSNIADPSSQSTEIRSHSSEDCALMWEYDFSIPESILCKREIRETPKKLFCILQAVLHFAFAEKSFITNRHLKTLLYYTCEDLPIEDIRHQPGKCLLYELDLLKEFLKRKHFPHYFMRGRNLIADMEYEDIAWYIERLEIVMSNLLALFYCVLDYCTLKNVFDLGTVFNDLCTAVYSPYKEGTNPDEYPVSLCVTSLAASIKAQMFKRARVMIDTWYCELGFYFEKQIFSKEDFVKKLLCSLPLQYQWLFALFIDCRDESDYLQFVCRGLSCVKFENLFGSNVIPCLSEETSLRYNEVHLPTSMLNESMIRFAKSLGEILYNQIGCTCAYQSAIHHFLKTNTHDLLLSIESDQREHRDNYTHVKLSYLRMMFDELYSSYQQDRCEFMYRDLMETFDELCNFLATEKDFAFLSQLWEFYGDSQKAREAHMKAVSVRNDSPVQSTSL